MTTPLAAPTNALRVRDVSVRFGSADGLRQISFEITRGERVVLVGPSGAGKTTLLRAIAGLTPVSAGTIEIGGRVRTDDPPERRDAVYLNQTPVLFPHLDVFGNIAFPLRVRGVATTEVRARVARALVAVRLEGFERRRPDSLSGGQRHRVALARAIVAQPAVLLLDEPLSSLDPALRDDVRDAIIRVQTESDAALLMVTHDLDEAGLIGNRVGVILDRRLAQISAPSVLFTRPASLAIARLVGISNEVTGVVDADATFVCSFGAVPLGRGEITPGAATISFRPDAVRLSANSPITAVVSRLLSRAERTTALVDASSVMLEVLVDSLSPPVPGERVALEFEPRRIAVFPDLSRG
ncbi:MAG: ABC transporter ATP-binding protein [Gemmatimonadaceae bacterium]